MLMMVTTIFCLLYRLGTLTKLLLCFFFFQELTLFFVLVVFYVYWVDTFGRIFPKQEKEIELG